MLFALAISSLGILLALVLTGPWLRKLKEGWLFGPVKTVGSDLKKAFSTGLLLQSFFIHALSIAAFVVLAQGAGMANIGILMLSALVFASLLVSALPISVGGWGVREAFVALSFAQAGYDSEAAVSVSILFGLAFFFTSLATAAIGGAACWNLPFLRDGRQ